MSDCFFCCIQSMCHVQTKNVQFWLWKGLGSCYISDSSCTSVCWTGVHCQSCQTTAAGNNLFLHNPVSGLENYFISHYLTSHWPGGCELLLLLKKKRNCSVHFVQLWPRWTWPKGPSLTFMLCNSLSPGPDIWKPISALRK